jgi:hypothetical protein
MESRQSICRSPDGESLSARAGRTKRSTKPKASTPSWSGKPTSAPASSQRRLRSATGAVWSQGTQGKSYQMPEDKGYDERLAESAPLSTNRFRRSTRITPAAVIGQYDH